MVKRERELSIVSRGLAAGRWFLVYAPPASGKTTFLAQLEQLLGHRYRTVYLSLRSCYGLEAPGVYRFLAGLIKPQAKAESILDLRDLIRQSASRLLILLDDAGSLAPRALEEVTCGISALHSESRLNPALSLGLVIAASKDLRGMYSGVLSCLNTLDELFLPDFTQEETRWQVGEAYQSVWDLAAGHPWLTTYLSRQDDFLPGVRERSLFDTAPLALARSRISAELLKSYREGVWADLKLARTLKFAGLAKESGGRLVARNKLFRQVIEEYLSEGGNWGERQIEDAAKPLLCTKTKEVYLAGVTVNLTAVEYRILEHLFTNSNRVLSKDSLAQAAFPFEPAPSVHVESHIKNIRRKLGDDAVTQRYIRSRRSLGYQAVAGSFAIRDEA